jgi:hypothetical protein
VNPFYNRQSITTLSDSLALFPADQFSSPTRSTVPLLSLLLAETPRLLYGSRGCSERSRARELHLEFTVNPPRGRGLPSQTDLMVLTLRHAFAVAAKWTEPRYETVSQWLGGSSNRPNVMLGSISLLQPYAPRRLDSADFGDAVYQMVHRAASACAGGRFRGLVYLQFFPLPDRTEAEVTQLREDLAKLHVMLGSPQNFPFRLLEVQLEWNSSFQQLLKLSKELASTGQSVCAALVREPLFQVVGIKTHRIDARRKHVLGVGA